MRNRWGYVPPLVHKAVYQSRLKGENAPPGHRTTLCNKEEKSEEVNMQWIYVNCQECLNSKNIKVSTLGRLRK